MAVTSTLRSNSCDRTSSCVLVDASQFTGPVRIHVENTGDFAFHLSQTGGSYLLNPGKSVDLESDTPLHLTCVPAMSADSRGQTYDYVIYASAVVIGEKV